MNLVNYIYLATILFAIGGATVLMRRNAIIVFMGVELMLNATNLVFVTFARIHGTLDGQVHRPVRHGRRRRRGRRGPRHHHGDLPCPPVGLGRRRQPAEAVRSHQADTRSLAEARPMAAHATSRRHGTTPGCSSPCRCSVPPLLLLGGRRTDRFGPLLATCHVLGVLRRRLRHHASRCSAATPTTGPMHLHLYDWMPAGSFQRRGRACSSTSCRWRSSC